MAADRDVSAGQRLERVQLRSQLCLLLPAHQRAALPQRLRLQNRRGDQRAGMRQNVCFYVTNIISFSVYMRQSVCWHATKCLRYDKHLFICDKASACMRQNVCFYVTNVCLYATKRLLACDKTSAGMRKIVCMHATNRLVVYDKTSAGMRKIVCMCATKYLKRICCLKQTHTCTTTCLDHRLYVVFVLSTTERRVVCPAARTAGSAGRCQRTSGRSAHQSRRSLDHLRPQAPDVWR